MPGLDQGGENYYELFNMLAKGQTWEGKEWPYLDKSSSDDDIKKAYRMLAIKYHPDKAPEGKRAEFEQIFQGVSNGYEILSNPELRTKHDQIAYGTPPPSNTSPPSQSYSTPPSYTPPQSDSTPPPTGYVFRPKAYYFFSDTTENKKDDTNLNKPDETGKEKYESEEVFTSAMKYDRLRDMIRDALKNYLKKQDTTSLFSEGADIKTNKKYIFVEADNLNKNRAVENMMTKLQILGWLNELMGKRPEYPSPKLTFTKK